MYKMVCTKQTKPMAYLEIFHVGIQIFYPTCKTCMEDFFFKIITLKSNFNKVVPTMGEGRSDPMDPPARK